MVYSLMATPPPAWGFTLKAVVDLIVILLCTLWTPILLYMIFSGNCPKGGCDIGSMMFVFFMLNGAGILTEPEFSAKAYCLAYICALLSVIETTNIYLGALNAGSLKTELEQFIWVVGWFPIAFSWIMIVGGWFVLMCG